jgi:hypothetical protein
MNNNSNKFFDRPTNRSNRKKKKDLTIINFNEKHKVTVFRRI